jgi:hypothetical protein
MIKNISNVGEFKVVHVLSVSDGVKHRITLSPGADISTEPQEVQDACNEAWTPEVVAAYEAHKAEQI